MTTTSTDDNANVMRTYYESWRTGDLDSIKPLLADDVTFNGPLGTADSAEQALAGLEGMAKATTDIVIHKIWVDGADVLTWFDLHTEGAPAVAVANWAHITRGKIRRMQVTFDPRPMLAG
jgi:ketosteroid isomerase-like protein